MSSLDEQIATQESLFRGANERIAASHIRVGQARGVFLCECADIDCYLKLELSLAEFARARLDAAQFVVFPGHRILGTEIVVEATDRYEIIRKLGEAGDTARDLESETEVTPTG
jgi:hypothetical protein